MGYFNWSSALSASALTFTCGRDNLKSFPCILSKFVMHVTNDQFSDKFNNSYKKSTWPIYCDFLYFASIIWPCGRNNFNISSIMAAGYCRVCSCFSYITTSILNYGCSIFFKYFKFILKWRFRQHCKLYVNERTKQTFTLSKWENVTN